MASLPHGAFNFCSVDHFAINPPNDGQTLLIVQRYRARAFKISDALARGADHQSF
jgi:hypothetical protein